MKKRSDHEYVKEGLKGILGNMSTTVKKYHKSEKKWKGDLKDLIKKILYLEFPSAPVHVVN